MGEDVGLSLPLWAVVLFWHWRTLIFTIFTKGEVVEGASSEYCCTLMSKLDSSIARVCRSSSRPLQKAFWWKFACKHSVGLLAAAAQSPRLWQKLGTHSFLEFLPTAAAEAGPGWPLVAVVRCWRRPRAFLYTDHYIYILHCLCYSSSTPMTFTLHILLYVVGLFVCFQFLYESNNNSMEKH